MGLAAAAGAEAGAAAGGGGGTTNAAEGQWAATGHAAQWGRLAKHVFCPKPEVITNNNKKTVKTQCAMLVTFQSIVRENPQREEEGEKAYTRAKTKTGAM